MIRSRTTAWMLALVSGVAGAAWAEPPSAPAVRGGDAPAAASAVPGGGPLVKDGQPPSLFLLYTGDVIGYLEPCG